MNPASPIAPPASTGVLSQPLSWMSGSDLIGVIVLILSLAGNAFQLYQQRVYAMTIYNGLVGAFNSVGWLLARSMNKTAELTEKLARQNAGDSCCSPSSRDYSLETEWHLPQLHEQLVAVAKTVRARDQRWQAGQFGLTDDEIERITARLEQQTRQGATEKGGEKA